MGFCVWSVLLCFRAFSRLWLSMPSRLSVCSLAAFHFSLGDMPSKTSTFSRWPCSQPAAPFPAPLENALPPCLCSIPTSWTLCLHLCWFTSLSWWRLLSHIFLRKVHGGQCLLKWCMLENAYNISYRFRISGWGSFPKLRKLFFFGVSFFVLEHHTTAFSLLLFHSGSF